MLEPHTTDGNSTGGVESVITSDTPPFLQPLREVSIPTPASSSSAQERQPNPRTAERKKKKAFHLMELLTVEP